MIQHTNLTDDTRGNIQTSHQEMHSQIKTNALNWKSMHHFVKLLQNNTWTRTHTLGCCSHAAATGASCTPCPVSHGKSNWKTSLSRWLMGPREDTRRPKPSGHRKGHSALSAGPGWACNDPRPIQGFVNPVGSYFDGIEAGKCCWQSESTEMGQ